MKMTLKFALIVTVGLLWPDFLKAEYEVGTSITNPGLAAAQAQLGHLGGARALADPSVGGANASLANAVNNCALQQGAGRLNLPIAALGGGNFNPNGLTAAIQGGTGGAGAQPVGVPSSPSVQPQQAAATNPPQQPAANGDATKGAKLYAEKCANCHSSPDSKGGKPDETNPQGGIARIMDGSMPKRLPGSPNPLSSQDQADVIAYLTQKANGGTAVAKTFGGSRRRSSSSF